MHIDLYSYHIHRQIFGPEKKTKDLLDAHYVSSIEHCGTVKKKNLLSISTSNLQQHTHPHKTYSRESQKSSCRGMTTTLFKNLPLINLLHNLNPRTSPNALGSSFKHTQ